MTNLHPIFPPLSVVKLYGQRAEECPPPPHSVNILNMHTEPACNAVSMLMPHYCIYSKEFPPLYTFL